MTKDDGMWIVIDSLIDPATGTVFSWITSTNKMNLILWHSGKIQFLPGDEIITISEGISRASEHNKYTIYHIIPFKPSLWSILISNLKCPNNNKIFLSCPDTCLIEICCYKSDN